MRAAKVLVNNKEAGILSEIDFLKEYQFSYLEGYQGVPVSLTMPPEQKSFHFDRFPPFFEGLLPEGFQLEGLLLYSRIDPDDLFAQLMMVGNDMVGAVTVKELQP